jgi:hypothetical protein
MPRIFTREDIGEVRLDNFGFATIDHACVVPQAVADEFAADPRFRIEADEQLVPSTAVKSRRTIPPATADEAKE